MPLPPEQIGSVPQAQAMQKPPMPQAQPQGQGGVSPQDIEYFRNGDADLKKAIEMFMGRPLQPGEMNNIPDKESIELAGMVHKLGVEGAVQMATKMIPQELQQKLRQPA